MPRPARMPLLLGAVLLASLCAGCFTPWVGQARTAEQAGRYYEAYELYRRAVHRQPTRGGPARDMRRVAPKAAAFWEYQGDVALERHEYEAAWRYFTKALLIIPSYEPALQKLQRLEREHADAVALAQAQYWRHGISSVAHVQPMRRVGTDRLLGDRTPLRRGPEEGAASEEELPDEATESADAPPVADEPEAVPERDRPARSSQYLHVGVISRDDDRFSKRARTVDGLEVEVRDTDSDPDADISVYRNGRRVAEAKDLRPGASVRLQGRSGRLYRLVILTIIDDTETVRFGVREVR